MKEDYIVVKFIGSGSQGKVVLVHKKTESKDNLYALKTVYVDELTDINQILIEFNRLQKLKHENICPYLEVFLDQNEEEDYYLNIVMPYCELGDLATYAKKKKKFTQEELFDIFLQISKGIEYLHDNNIAHRDIKLENVFLTQNNEEKKLQLLIGDFGYATSYNESSMKKTVVGTMDYVAPEIMKNVKYSGPKADMFSLGALFYFLLTGESKKFYLEFISNVETAELEIQEQLSTLSPITYLNEIVLLLLRMNPDDRLNASKVVRMLENPIIDFVDIRNIQIEFMDDKHDIYEKGKQLKKIYSVEGTHLEPKIMFKHDEITILYPGDPPQIFKFENPKIPLIKFELKPNVTKELSRHKMIVFNEKYLCLISKGTGLFWNISEGRKIGKISFDFGRFITISLYKDNAVCLRNDNKYLYLEIKENLIETKKFFKLKDSIEKFKLNKNLLCGISKMDDYKNIYVYDIDKDQYEFILKGHSEHISEFIIHENVLISASLDLTIRFWSLETGKCSRIHGGHLKEITCLKVVDEILLSGSLDQTIRYWNLSNGNCLSIYKHKHPILQFSIALEDNLISKKETKIKMQECLGWIKCGHCQKFIILCTHVDEENENYCVIGGVVIEKLNLNELCLEKK
eukprot:gene4094-7382_t